MKTIGLIGGMSWESTVGYYQMINQEVKQRLGGLNSAKILLNSVNFAPIEKLQHEGDWQKTAEILSDAAKSLERGGADCVLICTNTMHKVAEVVQESISIPLIHIADATGEELVEHGVKKVGLLGTAFTMEQSFYKGRLQDKFSLDVIVPNESQRKVVHEVIYQELCLGEVKAESKAAYLEIVDALKEQGAEGIILGCTEIGLLISGKDTDVKLYDTVAIHAKAAVDWALADD